MYECRLSLMGKGFQRYSENETWVSLRLRCSFATVNDAKKQRINIGIEIVVIGAIEDCKLCE
jgi:hypothetical protein